LNAIVNHQTLSAKRTLLDRLGQCCYYLIDRRLGFCPDFRWIDPAKWMGHDDNARTRYSKGFSLNSRGVFKNVRANDCARDAAFFKFDKVVDTPRGTGSSVAAARNDRVALLRHFIQEIPGNAPQRRRLPAADRGKGKFFFQQFFRAIKINVEVSFPVVQQSNGLAV
jgi:hypothetical protein